MGEDGTSNSNFASAYARSDIKNGIADTFWNRVGVGDARVCWEWQQSVGSHGYGQTFDGKTVRLAHRVAWVLTHDLIPEGFTVDHTCRTRTCCNPNHLRLLPNVANAKDNGPARRTHCPRGHAYDEANTYVTPQGHRQCRACRVRWR